MSEVPEGPEEKRVTEVAGSLNHCTEVDAVHEMLSAARAWQLEVEVVLSFANYMRVGYSVEEAAGMALYDWDI